MDARSLESTLRALGRATNQSLVQSVINDERFHRLLTSITTKLEVGRAAEMTVEGLFYFIESRCEIHLAYG